MEEVNISSTERINGKVKVFYGNKGYGFFEYDGNQLFFHVNQMIKRKRRIRKGDNASFVVIETESGIQAGEILFEDAGAETEINENESFADTVKEDAVTLLEIAEKENDTEVQETALFSEDKVMITAAGDKEIAAETKKEKTAKKSRSKKKKTEIKETEVKAEEKTEDKKEEKIEEKTESSQKKSAFEEKKNSAKASEKKKAEKKGGANKESAAKAATNKAATVKDTTNKDTTTNKEASDKEASDKDTSNKEVSDKEVSNKESSNKQTSNKSSSHKTTQGKSAQSKEPPKKNTEKNQEKNQDKRPSSLGRSKADARQKKDEGERGVDYQLGWLGEGYLAVKKDCVGKYSLGQAKNILLAHPAFPEPQEIDEIVISTKGIFVIETKRFSGELTINKNGNWIFSNGKTRQSLTGPVAQALRHHILLQTILKGVVPDKYIYDIICIAKGDVIIEGEENCPIPVMKVDMLNYRILTAEGKAENDLDIKMIEEKINESKVVWDPSSNSYVKMSEMEKRKSEAAAKRSAIAEVIEEAAEVEDEAASKSRLAKKSTVKKNAAKKSAVRKSAVNKTETNKSVDKKVSEKKSSDKKTSDKQAAAKKTTVKMNADKKTSDKKSSEKKTAVKKTTAKNTTAKKTETKKTAVKKTAAKNTTAKKTSDKTAAVKKTVTKTPAAKKTTAGKSDAKKTDIKKTKTSVKKK